MMMAAVAELTQSLPVKLACAVLDVPRSRWYRGHPPGYRDALIPGQSEPCQRRSKQSCAMCSTVIAFKTSHPTRCMPACWMTASTIARLARTLQIAGPFQWLIVLPIVLLCAAEAPKKIEDTRETLEMAP